MNDVELNAAVAKVLGGTFETDAGNRTWVEIGNKCQLLEDFTPSESYDTIITCIEAKGWYPVISKCKYHWGGAIYDEYDNVLGSYNEKSGPRALCLAFLEACKQEGNSDGR